MSDLKKSGEYVIVCSTCGAVCLINDFYVDPKYLIEPEKTEYNLAMINKMVSHGYCPIHYTQAKEELREYKNRLAKK